MKKLLSLSIIFLFIVSLCISETGCSSNTIKTTEAGPRYVPTCVDVNAQKTYLIHYNWMGAPFGGDADSCDLFRYGFNYTQTAFYNKGNINIVLEPTSAGTKQRYGIIYPVNGGLPAITTVLTNYRDSTYDHNYWGYLCGLDSLGRDSVKAYGYSIRGDHRWSFIMTGLARKDYQNDEQFIGGLVVHELGHQIKLVGHNIHGVGWHGGKDSAKCIMNWVSDTNKGSGVFCDAHICTLYTASSSPLRRLNDNFTSEVSINKNKYLESEDITVSIVFKNVSNKVDSLEYLTNSEILERLDIRNDKGEQGFYKGVIVEPRYVQRTLLRPGETKGFSLQILDNFGFAKEQKDYKQCAMNYFFPKGTYSIQYDDRINDLVSNKIELNVESPNDNEAIAREQLKLIYSIETPKGSGIKEKAFSLIDFAQKNKESAYSEQAFYIASLNIANSTNGWMINDDYLEKCQWFIDTFPNSVYINEIVWDGAYAEAIVRKNSTDVNSFLNNIIVNHPNTGASENARAFLTNDFLK